MTDIPPPISPQPLFGPADRAGGFGASAPLASGRRSRLSPRMVLTAIWLGAAVAGLWPLVVSLSASVTLQPAPLLAHVCGMLAGYGVVVLLGLMSRAPSLERGIGADVLTRWHGYGGRLVLTVVILHAWAATLSWAQSRQETLALASWDILGMPGLAATTLGTALLVTVGGRLDPGGAPTAQLREVARVAPAHLSCRRAHFPAPAGRT